MSEKVSALFGTTKEKIGEEDCQVLVAVPGCRIEKIVSYGEASPAGGGWCDQEEDEWVAVVRGAAKLEFDPGGTVEMTAGSYLTIPAHRKHRVAWTDPNQPTIWVAVFYRPTQRGSGDRLEDGGTESGSA